MSVSHGPVREAMRELESEDLLVIEPHRGAFVKAFTADDIREVYEFRSAIETGRPLWTLTHALARSLAPHGVRVLAHVSHVK